MKIISSRDGTSFGEIAEFERLHGILLPGSYKSFLIEHGEGMPSPSLFVGKDGTTENLGLIFSITSDSIESLIREFKHCLEDGLLPIALSGGGNYFFLGLETGAIFRWDHHVHDWRFSAADLDYLSPSIWELLSGLQGEEEPEPGEIEMIGESGDANRLAYYLKKHSIGETNEAGRTVAMEAARYGNLELLKECIRCGAEKTKLLHYAANNKTTEVIDFLLDLGLDINERDENEKTPLARSIVYDETRSYLIKKGAIK